MLTTKPEYNRPVKCVCAKCGKKYVSSPWTAAYSTNKKYLYRYHTPEPWESDESPSLVSLCDSCAIEELNAGNVSRLLY